MAKQPNWAWRLRADADERFWVRWIYKLLRWSTDSQSFAIRLFSIISLIFGIVVITNQVFILPANTNPTAVNIIAFVVIFLALKALLGHSTTLYFRDKKLIGGSPTEDNFDQLIPRGAKKVAIVGQNLGSRLDEKYSLTIKSIQKLLGRRDSQDNPSIEEILLVIMTPLALYCIHPKAAQHLQTLSLSGLRRLSIDLADDSERVKVVFHPAATLSMLVVDWHLEKRLTIITPKVQTLPIVNRRASIVLSGEDFDTVASHFDQFLDEARRCEFPGARMFHLSQAADELEKMFSLDVVQHTIRYIEQEERRK